MKTNMNWLHYNISEWLCLFIMKIDEANDVDVWLKNSNTQFKWFEFLVKFAYLIGFRGLLLWIIISSSQWAFFQRHVISINFTLVAVEKDSLIL